MPFRPRHPFWIDYEPLRMTRLRLRVSQRQLAEELGTSKQTICNIEHNRQTVAYEQLIGISRALGTEIRELYVIREGERP